MLYTVLFTLLIVALCILLLGVRVFFMKNGKFPHFHIAGNKALRKRGINCVESQDAEERKAKKFSVKEFDEALRNIE